MPAFPILDRPLVVFVVSAVLLYVAAWIGAARRKSELEEAQRVDFGIILGGTFDAPRAHHRLQLFDGHQPLRPA
jgi:hypothetical protein